MAAKSKVKQSHGDLLTVVVRQRNKLGQSTSSNIGFRKKTTTNKKHIQPKPSSETSRHLPNIHHFSSRAHMILRNLLNTNIFTNHIVMFWKQSGLPWLHRTRDLDCNSLPTAYVLSTYLLMQHMCFLFRAAFATTFANNFYNFINNYLPNCQICWLHDASIYIDIMVVTSST